MRRVVAAVGLGILDIREKRPSTGSGQASDATKRN